jgi:magnesium-transporting ATPase (P-type)
LSGRDNKVEKAFTLLEKNLYLLGATAVEDHLQAGVPEAIDFMLKAKLKVVVLTGDKKETAVTIAKQCHLITDNARILYVHGNSMEETKASLDAAINTMARLTGDTELLAIATSTPRGRAASRASPRPTPMLGPVPSVIPPSPLMASIAGVSPSPRARAPSSSLVLPPPVPLLAAPLIEGPVSSSSTNTPPTPLPYFTTSPAQNESKTLPVPSTGVTAVIGAAKEPTPHPSSPGQQALTASIAAAEGLVTRSRSRSTAKPTFALAIDGMAMEWCIVNYLTAYVALFRRCDTTVSYRSTPLQKAIAVRMAKKQMNATCLSVGDGANDVSMIQEADVGVGIMGKEGSHAAMSADYVVLRFKHLLRYIK